MHPSILVLAVAGVLCAAGASTASAAAAVHDGHAGSAAVQPAPAHTRAAPAAAPAPKLQAALRGLWHGHVVATRDYALAVHARRPGDARQAAAAVVANAKLLAGAVAGFYGDAAGERMLQLLAGHWGAVQAMTDARFANDTAARDRAMTALLGNAAEIARFLASANPNLPEDAVRGLLTAHGAHHAAQIQQIMAGDQRAEHATWLAMQQHMDSIADALAAALARQFPDKAA